MKDQQRQNAQRIKEGVYPEGPRSALKSPGYYDSKQNVVTSYSYQIKVQNNGNRTIKKIAWEYVFIDRETNKEMGKHKFLSKTNLKPRETDNLIEKHLTPPIYVIDAKNAGKNLSDLFIEQVNITRIEYSDGSIWESDAK